jgi:hypothetical protein
MDAAQTIRDAVSRTYAAELRSGPFQNAARFFLDELYSDKDYALRDAQFSRIAGALQSVFPKQVVQTAVSLAQLHVLTEELDHAMGIAWLTLEATVRNGKAKLYAQAWRAVGRRPDRELQLTTVLAVGQELAHLTRVPGLRMMLRMMRRPAQVAGLSALQQFLESGFDTFAEMSRERDRATDFLSMIRTRESKLIELLFSDDALAFEVEISNAKSA